MRKLRTLYSTSVIVDVCMCVKKSGAQRIQRIVKKWIGICARDMLRMLKRTRENKNKSGRATKLKAVAICSHKYKYKYV